MPELRQHLQSVVQDPKSLAKDVLRSLTGMSHSPATLQQSGAAARTAENLRQAEAIKQRAKEEIPRLQNLLALPKEELLKARIIPSKVEERLQELTQLLA